SGARAGDSNLPGLHADLRPRRSPGRSGRDPGRPHRRSGVPHGAGHPAGRLHRRHHRGARKHRGISSGGAPDRGAGRTRFRIRDADHGQNFFAGLHVGGLAGPPRGHPGAATVTGRGGSTLRAWMLVGLLPPLVLLPHFLTPYQLAVFAEILIWGLFAMAFDLLYGYTGMLSFGQAVFFGAGAYGLGFAVLRLRWGVWESLGFAVVVAAVLAAALGSIAVRARGHYFLILTITFSVISILVLQSGHWRWLSRGYVASPFVPPAVPLGPWKFSLMDSLVNYYW